MKIGKIAFEKSVGAVIFRKEKGEIKFLLLKYRSGQWDFPKGHIEQGESEKETLRREVYEETKIAEIEVKEGFRTTNRFFYTAKGKEYKERISKNKGVNIFKRVVYYIAQTKKDEVVLNFENKAFAWVKFGKAMGMLRNDGSKKTLARVRAYLERNP